MVARESLDSHQIMVAGCPAVPSLTYGLMAVPKFSRPEVQPFRKVGTHRRVLFKDLMPYRAASEARRKNVLDELTREPQELGLGY